MVMLLYFLSKDQLTIRRARYLSVSAW
jgi:hypothetical protein